MNLVSIVSSDKNVGSGHLGRTIKLNQYFRHRKKKINSFFITNSNDAKEQLINSKFSHINIDFRNSIKILNQLDRIKPRLIILDTYLLENKIKKKIYEKYKNVLVIDDDFKKKQFCKYYLNYNFMNNKNLQDIKSKIKAQKYLIGYKFFPTNIKKLNFKKRRNVLVFFGSTDKFKIMQKTLKIISSNIFKQFKFHIIIGKHFKVDKKKYSNKNFRFLATLPNDKFQNLLAKMEFAVGAGGVSLFERILYKITNLVIITADNQFFGTNNLKKRKFINLVGKADNISYVKYKKELMNFFLDLKKNIVIKKNLEKKIRFNNGLKKIYNYINL